MKPEIHDERDKLTPNQGTIHLTIVDNGVFETHEKFPYKCRITRQYAYSQAYKYFNHYKGLPIPNYDYSEQAERAEIRDSSGN